MALVRAASINFRGRTRRATDEIFFNHQKSKNIFAHLFSIPSII